MVLNKILHHRNLTGFEYASRSECAGITQGSVGNGPLHMFDRVLSIHRVLRMLGLEYTRVVNMPMFVINGSV